MFSDVVGNIEGEGNCVVNTHTFNNIAEQYIQFGPQLLFKSLGTIVASQSAGVYSNLLEVNYLIG